MYPYREFVPGQRQEQQQQRPPLPPAGVSMAGEPSVLRAAVNAPQFVPKSKSTPPFGSQASPSPPPGANLGYLKSTAAPFEPGARAGGSSGALNAMAVQVRAA